MDDDTASMHSLGDENSVNNPAEVSSSQAALSSHCECDIGKLLDLHVDLQQLSRDEKYRILTTEPDSNPSIILALAHIQVAL